MESTTDSLCDALDAFKRRKAEIDTAIENVQREIMSRMNADGTKTTVTRTGRKITIVEGSTSSWDEVILRDILPPEIWRQIVREVVDPNRLESVIERERISPETLVDALKVKPKKAYLKITTKKDEVQL